jgi:hypothetical protein
MSDLGWDRKKSECTVQCISGLRHNVVIAMPSGMHLLKKTEITITNFGPCLSVVWQRPQIMLHPIKVFPHSCFKRIVHASHPKVNAFVGETDKIWTAASKKAKNYGLCTSEMIVKLPPGVLYFWTALPTYRNTDLINEKIC